MQIALTRMRADRPAELELPRRILSLCFPLRLVPRLPHHLAKLAPARWWVAVRWEAMSGREPRVRHPQHRAGPQPRRSHRISNVRGLNRSNSAGRRAPQVGDPRVRENRPVLALRQARMRVSSRHLLPGFPAAPPRRSTSVESQCQVQTAAAKTMLRRLCARDLLPVSACMVLALQITWMTGSPRSVKDAFQAPNARCRPAMPTFRTAYERSPSRSDRLSGGGMVLWKVAQQQPCLALSPWLDFPPRKQQRGLRFPRARLPPSGDTETTLEKQRQTLCRHRH